MTRSRRVLSAPVLLSLAVLAACESATTGGAAPGGAETAAGTPLEPEGTVYHATEGQQPGMAAKVPQRPQDLPELRVERVSAIAPWPRGIAWVDDKLVVVSRGRHRNYGGPAPDVWDQEATLFEIDPEVREPFVPGALPSDRIANNGRILAEPDPSVVNLYDRSRPVLDNWSMDRPFCTLAYDGESRNLFVCAYAGADLSGKDGGATFRKNATDALLRYDLRSRHWGVVERHREAVVPRDVQTATIPNQYYPHHDPTSNPAPHGWLNGPNGCTVVGDWLYAVGKDNHTLARYDLRPMRKSPDVGPPPSELVLGEQVDVRLGGTVQRLGIKGHSAVGSDGRYLYLATRTSSVVLRFPIDRDGDLIRPVVGELVAEFEPYSTEHKRSADLWELIVDPKGRVLVTCSRTGRIWRFAPDPSVPFDGNDFRKDDPTPNRPYLDMRKLAGNAKAAVSNIVVAPDGSLYFCVTMPEEGRPLAGAVMRAVEVPASGV